MLARVQAPLLGAELAVQAVADLVHVARVETRIQASGSFALDDYGSGYSNELNLLELSPRYIKIDISIVRGIDTDRDKQQIVSNIVAYAHARSMQLIAEGIETEAQLRTVIGLGVDLLQGYYLSHPAAVPAPIAPAAQAVIDQLEHQRFNPLGL